MFYLFNNIIEEVKQASKNKLLLSLVSGLTLYTLMVLLIFASSSPLVAPNDYVLSNIIIIMADEIPTRALLGEVDHVPVGPFFFFFLRWNSGWSLWQFFFFWGIFTKYFTNMSHEIIS